jgi:hypothetical protein
MISKKHADSIRAGYQQTSWSGMTIRRKAIPLQRYSGEAEAGSPIGICASE